MNKALALGATELEIYENVYLGDFGTPKPTYNTGSDIKMSRQRSEHGEKQNYKFRRQTVPDKVKVEHVEEVNEVCNPEVLSSQVIPRKSSLNSCLGLEIFASDVPDFTQDTAKGCNKTDEKADASTPFALPSITGLKKYRKSSIEIADSAQKRIKKVTLPHKGKSIIKHSSTPAINCDKSKYQTLTFSGKKIDRKISIESENNGALKRRESRKSGHSTVAFSCPVSEESVNLDGKRKKRRRSKPLEGSSTRGATYSRSSRKFSNP